MSATVARSWANKTRVILFAAVAVAALYLLAVAPVRTYFQQRQQMAAAEKRNEVLTAANTNMTNTLNQLQSPAEVERLARQQYELVPQGQEAFAVMPPAQSTAPNTPPATHKKSESLAAHAWDDLTFWN